MRTEIKIFLSLTFVTVGVVYLIQEFHVPTKEVHYDYSSTDFIEPSERFLGCFEDLDCIKIRGSACPANSGGVEVCVDKDFFQEYLSEVEKKAGIQGEVACPEIYLVTNKTCKCLENKCNLM